MKQPYAIFIIIIAVLITFCCSIAGAESKKEINNEEMKILNQFPGYHLLGLNDLDSQTRDFFSKKFQNEIPGIVKSDFNGDGYQDYVILLRDNNSKKAKLVISFCFAASPCKILYQLDVKNFYNIVYIRSVKQGALISQTNAIDTNNYPLPVRLKYDGVKLTYLGKAEIVIYWNEKLKKIETIQTAD